MHTSPFTQETRSRQTPSTPNPRTFPSGFPLTSHRSPSRGVALGLALLGTLSMQPLLAQVPAVVANSTTPLASGFSAGPAVTDACGDVYVYEGGGTGIVEIQAGTGTVTVVAANTTGYRNSEIALYMDAAKQNLYFPDFNNFYTTHFDQLPIVNCVPGGINATFANNLGNLGNYYWGTAHDVAGDAAGNVYFTTTANVTQAIYKETYSASAATYTDTQVITWKNNINYIAADAAGDLFFVDNTTQDVYALYLTAGAYPAAPVILAAASNFGSITGLSVDPAGNLYIADNKNNFVYEIPNEAGKLNPADLFRTASVSAGYKVAVDANHNIFLSNGSLGAVQIKGSSASAPNTAAGQASASFPVTYLFNAAVAPTSISTVTGTQPSGTFTAGTSGCTVGTTYQPGSTCTVPVTYTPTAVGLQTGALLFTTSSGTITTELSGVGLGAAATIDPGVVTPTKTTLTSPAGIAVDNLGNVFVTDTLANTLTRFAQGAGASGTTVATGTLTLKAPQAVAVDNLGDIFIADTGNNRVVEIPVVNGVLSNAAAFALSTKLSKPQGVATDANGNLYVADTGDNNLLFIPSVNGALNLAAASSYGVKLNAPSAVTVDPSGNVFVAETGNNDVVEFPGPLGSASQLVVEGGLNAPTALATDASGGLFVVDSGSGNIFRYPNVGGNFGGGTFAGSTVLAPIGVAVDNLGNLYVTDSSHSTTAQIARVQTSAPFGTWNVGTTSDPLTASILSSGNAPLIFASPSYAATGATTAGFNVTSDGCAGQTLLPGGACAITATFKPPVAENNAQENLNLNSNAVNGKPVLQLVGTGAAINATTLTLVLTKGTPPLQAGTAVQFTATIGTGSGTTPATGTIEFFVNNLEVGNAQVANNVAVLNLPNGLPGGNAVTVLAVYGGQGALYSGSEGSLTLGVTALADTLTLTATTPFLGPQSANDNASNAKGPVIPLRAVLLPSTTQLPGGSVTFYSGTTVLGIASVVPAAGGTFQATINTTALRAGTANAVENGSFLTTYNLSAVYSGDRVYGGSTSNSLAVTIVAPPTTLPACATAKTPTCQQNTTGATFTITPNNPTITVTGTGVAGQSTGSATLTVTSYGGWAGVINFTCSGLPAYATCAPFPGAPLISASTPTATVPPTTIAFNINVNVPPLVPTGSSTIWWISAIAGLFLLATRRRLNRMGYLRAGHLLSLTGLVLLMVGSIAGATGCNSGGNPYVTPAGTSNVTVTVRAAQIVPLTTQGLVQLQDSNVPPLNITLKVQ